MDNNLKNLNENIIKIYYFDYNGRALVSKAILHFLKIPFTFVSFSEQEWIKVKETGKFEFQQLPALEINNKLYVQSIAIEIYLARKFDLLGECIEDEYKIFSLLCSKNDLIDHLRPLVRPDLNITNFEKDHLINNVLPMYFHKYEKDLISSKGKYFISDRITLADIVITILVYYVFILDHNRSLLLKHIIEENAPKLLKYVVKFYEKEMFDFFENHYCFNYEF